MNKLLFSVFLAFVLCGPASAATITWETPFTVQYHGDPEQPDDYFDPPLEFSGFFDIRENRLADFAFTVFGRTWTEVDVHGCACYVRLLPQSGGMPDYLEVVFHWVDGEDSWELFAAIDYSHDDSLFRFGYSVDGLRMVGASQGTPSAAGLLVETDPTVNVPEPGTFVLLGLGLAGVWLSRRRKAN